MCIESLDQGSASKCHCQGSPEPAGDEVRLSSSNSPEKLFAKRKEYDKSWTRACSNSLFSPHYGVDHVTNFINPVLCRMTSSPNFGTYSMSAVKISHLRPN